MEDNNNNKESFYKKYKTTILASRAKWMARPENIQKQKLTNQYRIQLYKNSYYKLLDLVEKGLLDKSVIDDLHNETKDKCEKLNTSNV